MKTIASGCAVIRFSRSATTTKDAPLVGQHTESVLTEFHSVLTARDCCGVGYPSMLVRRRL